MAGSGRARLRLAGLKLLGAALRRPAPSSLPPNSRILLIRPDHFGDVLLTTPAIAALRAALPNARLGAMVGPWSAEVLSRTVHLDEVRTCAFPGFARGSKSWLGGPYLELMREALSLRSRRYDLAVILRPDHWWGALLAAVAGIPTRLGYDVAECQPLLTHSLRFPRRAHSAALSIALVHEAAALAGVTMPAVDSTPAFRIDAREREWGERQLRQPSLQGTTPLIVLHPGSGAELKLWPPAQWARVIEDLRDQHGGRVLMTYSQADTGIVEQITRHTGAPVVAIPTDQGFGYLAALLERADVVIGVDSGPLHLATALGRPTVRLYGPTDPAIYGPWPSSSAQRVLRVDLPCSPCGNIVAPPCGAERDPLCLTMIGEGAVLGEIQSLLPSGANR